MSRGEFTIKSQGMPETPSESTVFDLIKEDFRRIGSNEIHEIGRLQGRGLRDGFIIGELLIGGSGGPVPNIVAEAVVGFGIGHIDDLIEA